MNRNDGQDKDMIGPTPVRARRLYESRSVAEHLEWAAVLVLPLTSIVAAVSLLSHAVR